MPGTCRYPHKLYLPFHLNRSWDSVILNLPFLYPWIPYLSSVLLTMHISSPHWPPPSVFHVSIPILLITVLCWLLQTHATWSVFCDFSLFGLHKFYFSEIAIVTSPNLHNFKDPNCMPLFFIQQMFWAPVTKRITQRGCDSINTCCNNLYKAFLLELLFLSWKAFRLYPHMQSKIIIMILIWFYIFLWTLHFNQSGQEPQAPFYSTFAVQFSSVQYLSRVQLFANPWITAHQVSLSITNSQSLPKLMSIESVMPSSHLILCCSHLLLPPIPPSIRVFSNESTLSMRWPKYWSFSFSISPSNEHPGLISFRMDWLDLLAVQGTLKSLLQYHSSKASVLRRSAFFIVHHIHTWPQEKP